MFQIFHSDKFLPGQPAADRNFCVASTFQQLIVRILVGKSSPLVCKDQICSSDTEEIVKFFMGTVYNANRNLRVNLRKFCHRLMKFLAAVAPEISDPKL